ncbi:MAG TPA: hypothetical protein VND64_02340 [Pirellulales bacterium]|nr:hypothetical protein [Pirellulales bacterium]
MSQIILWDGKSYDLESISRFSPALAVYAETHPMLEEDLSGPVVTEPWKSLRILAATSVGLSSFLLAFCIFLGLRPFGPRVPKFFSDALVPVLFFWAPSIAGRWISQRRSSIQVKDGTLTVKGEDGVVNYPLGECRWFHAFAGNDPMSFGEYYAQRIGIAHRDMDISFVDPCISCGMTAEMRDIWSAFLQIAAIPQGRDRTASEGWLAIAAAAVAFAVMRFLAELFGNVWKLPAAEFLCFALSFTAPYMAAMYASALAGNDRWSSHSAWFWGTIVGNVMVVFRFLAQADLAATAIMLAATFVLVLPLAWEITRPRTRSMRNLDP